MRCQFPSKSTQNVPKYYKFEPWQAAVAPSSCKCNKMMSRFRCYWSLKRHLNDLECHVGARWIQRGPEKTMIFAQSQHNFLGKTVTKSGFTRNIKFPLKTMPKREAPGCNNCAFAPCLLQFTRLRNITKFTLNWHPKGTERFSNQILLPPLCMTFELLEPSW